MVSTHFPACCPFASGKPLSKEAVEHPLPHPLKPSHAFPGLTGSLSTNVNVDQHLTDQKTREIRAVHRYTANLIPAHRKEGEETVKSPVSYCLENNEYYECQSLKIKMRDFCLFVCL